MNESQARKLAEVYASMGYDTECENTGGGIWLVSVHHPTDATKVTFGMDTVTYQNRSGEHTVNLA